MMEEKRAATPRLTNDKTLTALRRETAKYLEKWVARDGRLTTYICASCDEKIETPRPERHMVQSKGYWDSVMRCTNCGDLNSVKVWPSGKTTAKAVGI